MGPFGLRPAPLSRMSSAAPLANLGLAAVFKESHLPAPPARAVR